MTLESTTPASELAPAAPDKGDDERPSFTGDADGIAKAAEEYASRRASEPDAFEVRADDPEKALTAKQAGDEYAAHRAKIEAEKAALRQVLGEDASPTSDPVEIREVTPQQDQHSTLDAQAAYEHALAQTQQTQATAQQLEGFGRQLMGGFAKSYPELDTSSMEALQGSIQELATYAPDRATAAVYHLQGLDQQYRQAQTQVAAQQALRQQAVSVWAEAQDAAFARDNPIPDAARPALAKAGLKVLRDCGLSDAEIQQGWNGGLLRTAGAQALLYKAAKYELAQAAIKQRPVPPVPKVVKPGTGGGGQTVHGEKAASERLDSSGSVRDAAKLYAMRRGK